MPRRIQRRKAVNLNDALSSKDPLLEPSLFRGKPRACGGINRRAPVVQIQAETGYSARASL